MAVYINSELILEGFEEGFRGVWLSGKLVLTISGNHKSMCYYNNSLSVNLMVFHFLNILYRQSPSSNFSKIISEFIKKSENNNLHYIPVNNSSHIPSAKGMNIIIDNIFELF